MHGTPMRTIADTLRLYICCRAANVDAAALATAKAFVTGGDQASAFATAISRAISKYGCQTVQPALASKSGTLLQAQKCRPADAGPHLCPSLVALSCNFVGFAWLHVRQNTRPTAGTPVSTGLHGPMSCIMAQQQCDAI